MNRYLATVLCSACFETPFFSKYTNPTSKRLYLDEETRTSLIESCSSSVYFHINIPKFISNLYGDVAEVLTSLSGFTDLMSAAEKSDYYNQTVAKMSDLTQRKLVYIERKGQIGVIDNISDPPISDSLSNIDKVKSRLKAYGNNYQNNYKDYFTFAIPDLLQPEICLFITKANSCRICESPVCSQIDSQYLALHAFSDENPYSSFSGYFSIKAASLQYINTLDSTASFNRNFVFPLFREAEIALVTSNYTFEQKRDYFTNLESQTILKYKAFSARIQSFAAELLNKYEFFGFNTSQIAEIEGSPFQPQLIIYKSFAEVLFNLSNLLKSEPSFKGFAVQNEWRCDYGTVCNFCDNLEDETNCVLGKSIFNPPKIFSNMQIGFETIAVECRTYGDNTYTLCVSFLEHSKSCFYSNENPLLGPSLISPSLPLFTTFFKLDETEIKLYNAAGTVDWFYTFAGASKYSVKNLQQVNSDDLMFLNIPELTSVISNYIGLPYCSSIFTCKSWVEQQFTDSPIIPPMSLLYNPQNNTNDQSDNLKINPSSNYDESYLFSQSFQSTPAKFEGDESNWNILFFSKKDLFTRKFDVPQWNIQNQLKDEQLKIRIQGINEDSNIEDLILTEFPVPKQVTKIIENSGGRQSITFAFIISIFAFINS